MRTLSLKLSLEGLNLDAESMKMEPSVVVGNVVRNIMMTYANNQGGLKESERKMFYSLSEAMDKAIKDKAEEFTLTDEEGGFLKKCKREAKMQPSEILARVEKIIDDMGGVR